MGDKDRAGASLPLTVALDVPSAQVLADQTAVIQDLQFVMESCRRLLAELAKPEAERDAVVPLALWSAALVSYARCFSSGQRFGLTTDDLLSLPLQGEVVKFHKWVIEERNRYTRHPADPSEVAQVGVALAARGGAKRQIKGITVLATRHVLVDDTGVRQLGGLASELAKQTAERARAQQDVVLAAAQKLDLDRLYELPALPVGPDDEPGEDQPGQASAAES
ncbi:MAG TPA: hypothetical protein VK586_07220 [Streptosporangiaceae bacterium]|nr:hypothetical protein [Streptosporangiaceae bacterium]